MACKRLEVSKTYWYERVKNSAKTKKGGAYGQFQIDIQNPASS